MLDPYMQYSCGYWKGLSDDPANLAKAQEQKLHLICEKLQLKPGMQLLDIGCGWGGLAAYAAKHFGVSVTGVTISAEQQKYAQARCADLDVNIIRRITAIYMNSMTGLCLSGCLSTSGRKITPPILMWSNVI